MILNINNLKFKIFNDNEIASKGGKKRLAVFP